MSMSKKARKHVNKVMRLRSGRPNRIERKLLRGKGPPTAKTFNETLDRVAALDQALANPTEANLRAALGR